MPLTNPWTTDNRFSPGSSGAAAPADAPAAYSARWIDQGDLALADVVPDRQGFAYNDKADYERLITAMGNAGDSLRTPYTCGYQERDVTTVVMNTPEWKMYVRRAGGYIYVDAWLQPTATTEHHPLCDDDGWDHPGPCVIETETANDDLADWQYEVANGDTVLGLAEWIAHRDEADRVWPSLGDRSSCERCLQDIEYWPGNDPWRDRGNNGRCNSGELHTPITTKDNNK